MTELVNDLYRHLKGKCDHIVEVGIILGSDDPSVVVVENHVGITMSAMKPIFKYSMEEIYRLATDDAFNSIHQIDTLQSDKMKDRVQSLEAVSMAILIVKGDFPLAYKIRKNLIEAGVLTTAEELSFTKVLFTRHAKIPSGWEHRRWCLKFHASYRQQQQQHQQHMYTNCASISLLRGELETEKEICREMAEKHPKNYYAWVHRLWLLSFMDIEMLEEEMSFIQHWLHHHVSDHSACNHLIQIAVHTIRLISLDTKNEEFLINSMQQNQLIDDDLELTSFALHVYYLQVLLSKSEELIEKRPGHEALWCLRRSLFEMLLQMFIEVMQGDERIDLNRYYLIRSGDSHDHHNSSISCESLWSLYCPWHFQASTQMKNESQNTTDHDINVYFKSSEESKTYKSIGSLQNLEWKNFCSTVTSTTAQSMNELLMLQLICFIRSELKMSCRCATDHTAWDFEQQRRGSIRYMSFIMNRVCKLLSTQYVQALSINALLHFGISHLQSTGGK